jgi:peptidoglycan LD-endopeptidase CwlK
MPIFSEKSIQILSQAHSDLQVIFNEVIKFVDCTIIESYRDRDAQEKAVREGKSQVHFPFGAHNLMPSLAVDVSPYPLRWDDKKRFYVFWGSVKIITRKLLDEKRVTHGLRWGGDWKGSDTYNTQQFDDLDHFELVEIPHE